jgi:hypothetical protein
MTKPLKTCTRELTFALSPQEALDASDAAQRLEREADEREERLKQTTKGERDEIKALRSLARKRRQSSADRKELRTVQCHEEQNGWNIRLIRDDTGETIDEYAAQDEQQTDFAGLDTTKPGDLAGDEPLDPDYTPSSTSPKAPTERKPKKARGKRK